ncbi:hypothetical protein HPP92_025733 [Vanilla planifolia]|uniref:Peptidase S8/S53 domain-containing protein n=1 Tax=Vanilla planifolia TaxID=51239 RepID=A0A835PJK8_VANPL|nr:hypothetical protein HPP92_026013 [Vanilla planifolia]KAG0454429.1 hypothetical protein HPP92_025733 [Vanilla planifolia]
MGTGVAPASAEGSSLGFLTPVSGPRVPAFSDRGMPPVPPPLEGRLPGRGELQFVQLQPQTYRSPVLLQGPSRQRYARCSRGQYVSPGTPTATGPTPRRLLRGRGGRRLGLRRRGGCGKGDGPMAHVAVYKVCWFSGCYSSDILAGMDDAVSDGVDVLSLSLGGFPLPLFEDSIAIGGFRAVERGVAVVCAAGNNGPVAGSVANDAPWITTVGAGTMDRRFPAVIRLNDGRLIYGSQSIVFEK